MGGYLKMIGQKIGDCRGWIVDLPMPKSESLLLLNFSSLFSILQSFGHYVIASSNVVAQSDTVFADIEPRNAVFLAIALLVLLGTQIAQKKRPTLSNGYFAGWIERFQAGKKAKQQEQSYSKEFSFRCGNVPVCDAQMSTLVAGSPGTGKSYSVIVPAVLSVIRQEYPIVLYDFAYPELSEQIAGYAASCGYQVHVFAPGYSESEILNPVEVLLNEEDIDTAKQFIQVVSQNQTTQKHNSSENDFFARGGISIAEAAICLAKSTPYPDLVMASAILGLPRLTDRLQACSTLNPWIRKSFEQLISVADSEKTAAGLLASAQDILRDFLRPRYLASLCGASPIPFYLEGKQLLILGVDRERGSVVSPILAGIVDLLVNKNAIPTRKNPIFMVLDEAPSLYLPRLPKYLAENRKYGMGWLLGVQNQGQLNKVYSVDLAQTIFSTCGTKILFNPREYSSAKLYSDLLGEVQIDYSQYSRSRGAAKSSTSITPQHRTRPLYHPNQFLKMKRGNGIVLNSGFSNHKETFVPFKTKFKLSKQDQEAIAISRKTWPQMRQSFEDQTCLKAFTALDLSCYQSYAENLLPLIE